MNDKDYGHLVDHAGIVLDKTTYLFGGMNETGVFGEMKKISFD